MCPRSLFARFSGMALAVLVFSLDVFAQDIGGAWALLSNSPMRSQMGRHDDAFFISPTTGWVVNLSGEVHFTRNGGTTWSLQHRAVSGGRPIGLRSVGFANAQKGWIGSLTDPQLLFETQDGGRTWSDITNRITGPRPRGICGLWVASEQVIYGVGRFDGPARIIKTTDGGQTWTSKDLSPLAETLIDAYFFDENRGIIIGGTDASLNTAKGVVLYTEDGGETWSVRHTSSGNGEWGWKISFPTPKIGYVSIENFRPNVPTAKVLKTTDAGLTWTEVPIEGSRSLQGVGFLTEKVGWASGRGTTFMTTDGGDTWEQLPLDGIINRFRMFGDSLGYAVGSRVYKLAGRVTTDVETEPALPVVAHLAPNYPNPFQGSTTIGYIVRDPGPVSLKIYDVLGRPVRTLVDDVLASGSYQAHWDGTDAAGRHVGTGIYVYRLETGTQSQSRRMIIQS